MRVTIELSQDALELWFGRDLEALSDLTDAEVVTMFYEDIGAALDEASWTIERDATQEVMAL